LAIDVFGPLLLRVEVCGRRRGECRDEGTRRGAAGAAAVTARRRAPGDGPTYAKASAFAKAMADKPVGRHIRAHAQELITFPRGGKTDWGKKRIFVKIYFNHG